MITTFSKGFYGKPREHAAFLAAVREGDCREIALAAKMSESERPFVDSYINATPEALRPTRAVQRATPFESPAPDSVEFLDELNQVYDLAKMRDEPLDQLDPSLPRGLTEVSPILLQERFHVKPYKKGVDYGESDKDWRAIQEGKNLAFDQSLNKRRPVETLRDAATFVHNDDPVEPWEALLKIILAEGIEPVLPPQLESEFFDCNGRFVLYGYPFYKGILGEALRELGYMSFYHKWAAAYPRPEEVGHYYGYDHLPLAYAEGSPMHPARGAMHSMAAKVMGYILKMLFKAESMLKATGESLNSTINHLQDNIGMWRLAAGVHYMSDHTCVDPIAKATAQAVVSRYIRGR